MEAVIFIGIQGSGKSTFYRDRFFDTHVRLSLDLLKTRHRERLILQACLATGQRFVVDNTNPSAAVRTPLILLAHANGADVVGYFFNTEAADALRRNRAREGRERVPDVAIFATRKKLEPPTYGEGFDRLFAVTLDEANRGFEIVPIPDGHADAVS